MKTRWMIVIVCASGLVTACGGSVTPSPTLASPVAAATQPRSTIPPARTATIPSTPAPSAQPSDTPAPALSSTLAPPVTVPAVKPPLLIAPSANGLLLVSADGKGKLTIPQAQLSLGHSLNEGIAPHGGLAAFVSGDNPMTPDREGNGPLTLNVLNVNDGSVKPITPLFSPDMEQAIITAAAHLERNAAIEAGIAIAENNHTLAWSPDGRYLAFIAAIDGPSSDVYSYDRETGQINRLTDGPNQAARLFWSPDSQWIVHEEVESFGTGAGWNVKAAWAAAPDGNNTRKLYDATSSGDETFVTWTAPDTFLVTTWTPIGLQNVRLVSLNSGEAQRIGPAFAVQAFAFDPRSQAQLYMVDDFTAKQNGLTGGLYLASPALSLPRQIAPGDWYKAQWLPQAGLFFAQGPAGVISITSDGTTKNYDGEKTAIPVDSPDGAWLLTWGDGNFTSPTGLRLYSANGELAREITSDSVTFATWSPDSNGVFYLVDGALYHVAIPNGKPTLVEASLISPQASSYGWVQP